MDYLYTIHLYLRCCATTARHDVIHRSTGAVRLGQSPLNEHRSTGAVRLGQSPLNEQRGHNFLSGNDLGRARPAPLDVTPLIVTTYSYFNYSEKVLGIGGVWG